MSSQSSYPDFETLTVGLTQVFSGISSFCHGLTILSREPNVYASSFESEIVLCRFIDKRELKVFCKYGVDYVTDNSIRRGVPYEAEVYHLMRDRKEFSTPLFYGTYKEETSERVWLVLEYLESYSRVNKTSQQDAMRLAARWIGKFHAASEKFLLTKSTKILNNYNVEYFNEWSRRVSELSGYFKKTYPWLSDLCEHSIRLTVPLLETKPTIIHGEFYPSNALISNGNVYIVDWESAGIGAGELDLAALTQGPWPEEITQECEKEYKLARWLRGAPPDFDRTMAVAKLYFYFRVLLYKLEYCPDQIMQDNWLFEQMLSIAEQLALI